MAEKSQLARKLTGLKRYFKVRPRVLIAGILGGGTMIAFPAASALVVVYIAVTVAAIGMMAWTGMIAFASAAAAALIVPVATVVAVFGVIAGVRWVGRMASPVRAVDDAANQQRPADGDDGDEQSNALQESLDDWETDGGPPAPARRNSMRRRVRAAGRLRASVQEKRASRTMTR